MLPEAASEALLLVLVACSAKIRLLLSTERDTDSLRRPRKLSRSSPVLVAAYSMSFERRETGSRLAALPDPNPSPAQAAAAAPRIITILFHPFQPPLLPDEFAPVKSRRRCERPSGVSCACFPAPPPPPTVAAVLFLSPHRPSQCIPPPPPHAPTGAYRGRGPRHRPGAPHADPPRLPRRRRLQRGRRLRRPAVACGCGCGWRAGLMRAFPR